MHTFPSGTARYCCRDGWRILSFLHFQVRTHFFFSSYLCFQAHCGCKLCVHIQRFSLLFFFSVVISLCRCSCEVLSLWRKMKLANFPTVAVPEAPYQFPLAATTWSSKPTTYRTMSGKRWTPIQTNVCAWSAARSPRIGTFLFEIISFKHNWQTSGWIFAVQSTWGGDQWWTNVHTATQNDQPGSQRSCLLRQRWTHRYVALPWNWDTRWHCSFIVIGAASALSWTNQRSLHLHHFETSPVIKDRNEATCVDFFKGIATNGVSIFSCLTLGNKNAVDGADREQFDLCDGHPAPGDHYHYHKLPTGCVYQVPSLYLSSIPVPMKWFPNTILCFQNTQPQRICKTNQLQLFLVGQDGKNCGRCAGWIPHLWSVWKQQGDHKSWSGYLRRKDWTRRKLHVLYSLCRVGWQQYRAQVLQVCPSHIEAKVPMSRIIKCDHSFLPKLFLHCNTSFVSADITSWEMVRTTIRTRQAVSELNPRQ